MTLLSLWTDVNSTSPCLMTASYRAFFASGLFVSTTPFTRSIEQLSLPAAIKRERSLLTRQPHSQEGKRYDALIHKLLPDTESAAQVLHRDAAVALEELRVGLDAHLADVIPGVNREEARGDEVVLLDDGCVGGM